jgi:DNA polymerase-3 subunit beta
MKFSIQREGLLHPISQVVGVVERRQTLPVLANFLISAKGKRLSITGTDMEVELLTTVEADIPSEGEITVPARKLVDIVRMLPEGVNITAVLDGNSRSI